MRIRERQERIERQTLSEYAAFADTSLGRARPETECDVRTAFCRDRDRIIHSKAFRRLKEKTQVFISPEGDHYRTRLTHTLEVSQIARTIARAMRLNEDLTEAIALGHDLGHTPFGHAGERALNELMPRGFRHYEQSARVVERIEKGGRGLNLTRETVDGILRHTTGELPRTVEGRVVRLADRIAYLNHDIEDAAAAGVPAALSLPADITEALGNGKSERITALVNSLLEHSSGRELRYGEEVRAAYDKLYDYMFENIYLNTDSDVKSEERKVRGLISRLFEHYVKNPEVLPEFCSLTGGDESPETAAADYISGMSDSYAMRCFEELFVPRAWTRE